MTAAKTWLQSFTGRMVTPLDLRPEQVCIQDIAHALSNKCRYTGHASEFLSVAQHALFGSEFCAHKHALAFLLHEVSEAYLPDIASPLKPHVFVTMPGIFGRKVAWKDLERRHAEVVGAALGLPDLAERIEAPEVHAMDLSMLAWEVRDLMGEPPAPWWEKGKEPKAPTDRMLVGLPPAEVERLFLYRYQELRRQEGP